MTSPSTLLLQGEGRGAIKIELIGKIWPLLKIENLASNFEGQHLSIVKTMNSDHKSSRQHQNKPRETT